MYYIYLLLLEKISLINGFMPWKIFNRKLATHNCVCTIWRSTNDNCLPKRCRIKPDAMLGPIHTSVNQSFDAFKAQSVVFNRVWHTYIEAEYFLKYVLDFSSICIFFRETFSLQNWKVSKIFDKSQWVWIKNLAYEGEILH